MMLKMLADMAGVTPEEITETVEQFRDMAGNGIGMLEQIDARLARIESKLGISEPALIETREERQSNGEEIGT